MLAGKRVWVGENGEKVWLDGMRSHRGGLSRHTVQWAAKKSMVSEVRSHLGGFPIGLPEKNREKYDERRGKTAMPFASNLFQLANTTCSLPYLGKGGRDWPCTVSNG